MFVDDLRAEVLELLSRKERVILLVSLDVDAVCACKILKHLFQQEELRHSILPVSGQEDLISAYQENKEQIKHFFLINCGGNINITETFSPDEDSTFYVADSHRPLDLDNVYNQDQVKILIREGDTFDEIPDFEKIYEEEEDDNEEEEEDEDKENEQEEEGDEPSSKRQKTGDISYLEKKVKKRKWVTERDKILFEYYEYSYYGSSAALILYELAWKMSKDSNDLLWWAISGLTEQYLFSKIDREKYHEDADRVHKQHVLRNNVVDENHTPAITSLKISFENELRLSLYRHWSLSDSFCNSQYTTCGLRLFTMKGKKRLKEYFADMGIPITQVEQKFASMDMDLRGDAREKIQKKADKYGLDDLSFGSFMAKYGYRTRVCASDMVYAISALLEFDHEHKHGNSYSANFFEAVDALSRDNSDKLENGIELAKKQIECLVTQVRSFIDTHQIVCAGMFLYAHAPEGTLNSAVFSKQAAIGRLARFTLEAYSVMTSNKKARNLPFVLVVPHDAEAGTSLLVGVPPVSESSPKNFFGAAFQQAAEKTKSKTHHDFFDPTIIEIKTEDRVKFFDTLSAIMS